MSRQPTGRRRGRPRKDAEPVALDEIMAAVLHAFASRGYDGVSVRTLNAELGFSHNLLYQRFGSKAQLWRAAVDWGFGGVADAIEQADDQTRDLLDRLHAIIRTLVLVNGERPDLLRLVTIEGSLDTDRLAYLYDTYMTRTSERTQAIIDQLVTEGRIRPAPWRSLFFLITAGGSAVFTSEALARHISPVDPRDADQIRQHADFVADLIVTGLTTAAPTDLPDGATASPRT